uniref:Transposase n=1 Tax=Streptomyces sp. NBC_00180 TaxID=2903632 RepID=A0AAU1I086_9ACTN
MFRKLPSDLTPTEDSPGLRVRGGTKYTRSQGDYVCCGCGAEDHANGDNDVTALVQDYTDNHGPAHRKGGSR